MISISKAIELSGQSMSAVATAVGVSAAQMSRVANHDYKDWESKERTFIEEMVRHGLISMADSGLEEVAASGGKLWLNPATFIPTENTMALDELGRDLLDPSTTLNSSIGVVYGRAGYGKTTSVRHFCAVNDRVIYTLFMEGYTLNMLLRALVSEFRDTPSGTFDRNLEKIRQATAVYRRLIVIDEADHCPLKVLEALRNINEACGVPIMLVGEYGLQAKMASLPRLESRVRGRPLEYKPLSVMDVALYWKEAVGLDLTQDAKLLKRLLARARGDFRLLADDTHNLVSAMNASGVSMLTSEVLDGLHS